MAPWADQPFALIPTSKISRPKASPAAVWIADDMTGIHNALIRCLNSMYQQAPYVKSDRDIHDLLQYSIFWWDDIHHHHDAEETMLFPVVEKITGQTGIMERNIVQHKEFHPGLTAFHEYTIECLKKEGTRKFDAVTFRGLIDAFAVPLVTHLAEEIETLLALDKYDIKAIKKEFEKFVAFTLDCDKYSLYPLIMGACDRSYEGGNRWPDGAPFFVFYLVHYWFGRRYRSVWRFSPSTMFGERRPLTFLPKEAS